MAFSLVGCSQIKRSSLDDEKDPHYIEGERRIGGMDWDGAIQSFDRALQSNPRNAAAHFQLGVLYYSKKQDFAAAIYHYQRHLALNPKSAMADLVRQHILFSKRELARTDSYPAVDRQVQGDLERLTLSNNVLKRRVDFLENEMNRRPAYITNYVTNYVKLPHFEQRGPNRLTEPAEIVEAPAPQEVAEAQPPKVPEVRSPQRPNRQKPVAQRTPSTRSSAPAEVRSSTPSKRTVHTVRPGETMAVLARRYGISVKDLRAANPGLGSGVRAGQKINIPAK